uniref:Putative coiled-coil domain-containing protein 22 isoform X2 n=1 Tax=Davidia involucrata TaxID=16924 RepID=A0A5B7A883_DAVIN
MCCLRQFLYPSEEDLYKLVRFLVERLSGLSEVGKTADKRNINTSATITDDDFKATLKDWTVKADSQGVDLNDQEVRTGLKELKLKTEVPESSNSKAGDDFVSGSHDTHLIPLKMDEVDAVKISGSRMLDFSGEEVTSVENGKRSTEEFLDARIDASVNEETAVQRDDKHVSELGQKLISLKEQSSKTRYEIEKLQSREKKLMEEATAKTLESQHQEEEHELLKAAVEMAFDDQHDSDFYIVQLNEQVDAKRRNLVELESQWSTIRKPLEEKRRSLEEALYATKPEAQEKLQKFKEIELEIQSVLSETKKREEEHSKLSADFERQPKLPSRRSYIQRITEITKNSRKQDADIERILKETRELQLESNSIQERLHRTYAVVDETVFREAKKDPVARQAYRLLTSIHESFEQISEKILTTDRTQREVAEHEAKLAALASQSLNIDKLQADLDAIRKENELLEQRLHDT